MTTANVAFGILTALSCGFCMSAETDQTLIEARNTYVAALVDSNPGMNGTDVLLSLSTWEASTTWASKTRNLDLTKLDLDMEADAIAGMNANMVRTIQMSGLAAQCGNRGSPRSMLRCYRSRLKTVCDYMTAASKLAGTSSLLGEDLGKAMAKASRSCEDALAEFNSDLSSKATPDLLDNMASELQQAVEIFEKRKTHISDLLEDYAP